MARVSALLGLLALGAPRALWAGAAASEEPEGRRPAEMLGGGNFDNGRVTAEARRRFALLGELGARGCRVNLYPHAYLVNGDWGRPNATALDAILALAHEHGVTPMVLFEYYAHYYEDIGLGTEEQWFAIGRAFAERYRPGGAWAAERGIRDYGITLYTAFNEPEGTDFEPGRKLGPGPYVAALRGLARGVHAVDPGLQVMPGGFKSPNAADDWALRGIGPALAPLWNDGTLAGIDLHTYFDVQYAPMEGGYANSAQSNFDQVKRACGITADVGFIATEFNYKKRQVSEEQAACGFLTAIWDSLGVVGGDGSAHVARLAFPWNIFHRAEKDDHYGMSHSLQPYRPTARGEVLRLVLRLTRGMTFVSLDPRGTGVFVLQGEGRKLWVWQNRKGWSSLRGTRFEVRGIPPQATRLEVYGWDGLRRTIELGAADRIIVADLEPEQTHMFLAR